MDRSKYMQMYHDRSKFKDKRIYTFKDNIKLITGLIHSVVQKKQHTLRILDYGCGDGSAVLSRVDVEVVGYDTDVNNEVANYHSLDEMEAEHFDVIVLSHVVEHMSMDELLANMKWCSEHADYLIVLTPRSDYPFNDFWGDFTHIRPCDNVDFLCLLEWSGWNVVNYYHCDWRVKAVPLINSLLRFIFCILTYMSPFMGFVVFAKKKENKV